MDLRGSVAALRIPNDTFAQGAGWNSGLRDGHIPSLVGPRYRKSAAKRNAHLIAGLQSSGVVPFEFEKQNFFDSVEPSDLVTWHSYRANPLSEVDMDWVARLLEKKQSLYYAEPPLLDGVTASPNATNEKDLPPRDDSLQSLQRTFFWYLPAAGTVLAVLSLILTYVLWVGERYSQVLPAAFCVFGFASTALIAFIAKRQGIITR